MPAIAAGFFIVFNSGVLKLNHLTKVCYRTAKLLTTLALLSFSSSLAAEERPVTKTRHAEITFHDLADHQFSDANKALIAELTDSTIIKMKKLMPELVPVMKINMKLMDRDLAIVNHVTGRADYTDEIEVSISTQNKDGISAAIEAGYVKTLVHELHHTVRGWVIHGNAFGPGIAIAAANEGLADTFAKIHTGSDMHSLSNDVDFDAWTNEILALAKDANYGEWMFLHPDGRIAVGYRAGAYLIEKAMENSGKDILELSKYSVKELYRLAGYAYPVPPRSE